MAEPAGTAGGQVIPPIDLIVRLEIPGKPVREFSYDFRQDTISIGRDPKNDIQIPLTTVSRFHARIFYELGDYFLEDLGSTHGTHLNERKMAKKEKKLLRDGDVMKVMSFSLTFKTTAASLLDRQPGEKTEHLARRMVQEVLSSLGGGNMEPPALRAMNGPDEGRRFEIADDQAEVTVGRSPECDFAVNDQNCSRRHCLVKRTWNGFTIQDLGSKNGVLVNNVRAEGTVNLKDGDEIQLGGLKMIFIDPASRILEQFGGGDDTVGPGTGPVENEYEEDGEEEEYEESEEYAEDEPEPELDPAEAEPAAPDEFDDVDGDEEEDPEIDLPDPSQFEVPKTGNTEWLILLIGGAIFLAAAGLAVFMTL